MKKRAIGYQRSAISGQLSAISQDERIELGNGRYTFAECAAFASFVGEPAPDAVSALHSALTDYLVEAVRSEASHVIPSTPRIARVSQSVRTSDDG